ncbi:MAG TPA: GMC family oxidoreductase N-terminal domain-containing protein, partial [Gaiellaceae bacterium]|nr:GMC family oxidoreductase N-terminal domain-containing protein [Gaiellaceae bacterium]
GMRDVDVVVVGSGFGGSVAALRLAEKGYEVAVLEEGRRFEPEDFPKTNWDVRNYLWAPRLGCRGIQRITPLRDVLVLSGAGVGGGSLVYANTLYEPPPDVWQDDGQAAELAPHYDTARRMLGVTRFPGSTPADEIVRGVAARLGVADTFEPTPVGVYFGGDAVDPYFEGEGPLRNGCDLRGACMTGCRRGAKNSLDRNYLWLAERRGATIHAETSVRRIAKNGVWHVETSKGTWRAKDVVLAAGVLGTLRILFRSGLGGPRVGDDVRTNSEVIVGASTPKRDVDYSHGVAITSMIKADADTHIQPVRYGKGSNLMGLLGTIMVDEPGLARWAAAAVRHPWVFANSYRLRRWSERTVILLVMQTRESTLRVRMRRGRLTTLDSNAPGRIPVANEAGRIAAELMGGHPGSSINEVVLGTPTTAHILGGATHIIDGEHRVNGAPGLHVVDGAAVGANLGVNPSLTIAAQAERAMSFWPST